MAADPARPPPRRRGLRLLLLAVPVLLFAAILIGYAIFSSWAGRWLGGNEFRLLAGRAASGFLRARGEFLPFHWNGSSLYTDGFMADGLEGAAFSKLRVDQIRAGIEPRALLHRTVRVPEITAERLEAVFGRPATEPPPPAAEPAAPPPFSGGQGGSRWLPNRLDLGRIVIREAGLRWQTGGAVSPFEIRGAGVTLQPESRAVTVAVSGGRLLLKDQDPLQISEARLRFQNGGPLHITSARLQREPEGALELSGKVAFGPRASLDLAVVLERIPVTPLLKPDWRARLHGNLGGKVRVQGEPETPGGITAAGALSLSDGSLEGLPILERIAAFTRTRDYRRLNIHSASAEFTWTSTRLEIRSFAAESKGLLRMEGNLAVEGGRLDGGGKVGVTPASLQWLPGSRERVFTEDRGGYLWAPVRVSGTVDNPQEDLSARLIAAAGTSLIEGAREAVGKGVNEFLNLLDPILK